MGRTTGMGHPLENVKVHVEWNNSYHYYSKTHQFYTQTKLKKKATGHLVIFW
jgi:hypothetical protein